MRIILYRQTCIVIYETKKYQHLYKQYVQRYAVRTGLHTEICSAKAEKKSVEIPRQHSGDRPALGRGHPKRGGRPA